jgi:protein-disulfide isomerase
MAVSKTLNPEQYVSRRGLLLAGAAAATGLLAWSLTTNTRTQTAARGRTRTKSARLPPEDLLKPGPMPDLALGSPDAPVTIVEYASLTCPACANFHNKVLPALKEKYIDTGKVRLVFREFVLNEKDARAAMMSRCVGGEKSLPLVFALFAKQEDWAHASSTNEFFGKLFAVGQQAGITRQSFNKCQQDEKLLKKLVALRDRGAQFGVDKTPTFFVNGTMLEVANATIEDFDKALEPLLTR